MADYELLPPSGDVVSMVEEVADECGLSVHRGSLAKYAGCTHWHFQQPHAKGTLEATWWPAKRRLWLHRRSNRFAPWMDEVVARFQERFSGS